MFKIQAQLVNLLLQNNCSDRFSDQAGFEKLSSPVYIKWASTRENLSSGFANNKVADQPAHPRSPISTFVIHFWKVSYVNLLQVKFQFSSMSL